MPDQAAKDLLERARSTMRNAASDLLMPFYEHIDDKTSPEDREKNRAASDSYRKADDEFQKARAERKRRKAEEE